MPRPRRATKPAPAAPVATLDAEEMCKLAGVARRSPAAAAMLAEVAELLGLAPQIVAVLDEQPTPGAVAVELRELAAVACDLARRLHELSGLAQQALRSPGIDLIPGMGLPMQLTTLAAVASKAARALGAVRGRRPRRSARYLIEALARVFEKHAPGGSRRECAQFSWTALTAARVRFAESQLERVPGEAPHWRTLD